MATTRMQTFARDEPVTFFPLTRLEEDGEWIVGRPETGTFVVLDAEALEVIDWLGAGLSVGETAQRYERRHGEALDLDGFLGELATKGFLSTPTHELDTGRSPPGREPRTFHLEWLAPGLGRRIFSTPVLAAAGALVALAAVALVLRPHLMPSWRALYFPEGLGVYGTALVVASFAAIAVHELAHLLAARAVGVSCRFGLGNRLWILVAETDMSGIWAVERRKRFLPFLAGPIADATGAAALVVILFAADAHWISLPQSLTRFASGMLLVYLLALLWQCYFFVRTDFYYVLANLLRCKNLMADTQTFLRARLAALLPWMEPRETAPLPPHERRAVRWFALVWLAGRGIAIAVLVIVQLPLAWSYLRLLAGFTGPQGVEIGGRAVSPTMAVVALAGLTLGLTLWLSQLAKRRR